MASIRVKPACPICGAEGETHFPWPSGDGEMRLCSDCDLVFAWPIDGYNPIETYSRAYLGQERRAQMDEFARRLQRRSIAVRHEKIGLWSPAHHKAFEWLEANVPKGATVMEVGCGVGAVLRGLKHRGYDPVGVDVAKPVIEAAEAEGFRAWCGGVETIPEDWPEPSAIVSFFVLHHLPDPVCFFKVIRNRWPAPLLIGYNLSPTKKTAEPHNFPPRTLGWWTETSIKKALTLAGYDVVQITRNTRTMAQLNAPSPLRNAASSLIWRWPWLRLAAGHAVDTALAIVHRALKPVPFVSRKLQGSLLIIALPRNAPGGAATQ